LYFGLHKNNKRLDQYVYIKSTDFCVAHNIKKIVIKFCILIDYNTDYVLVYFQKNWNLKLWFLIIILKGGSTGAREPKAFSADNISFIVYTLYYVGQISDLEVRVGFIN
jgi:hypothetical protein